jgi:RNA polymerase sigma factor (sigma-70 family)
MIFRNLPSETSPITPQRATIVRYVRNLLLDSSECERRANPRHSNCGNHFPLLCDSLYEMKNQQSTAGTDRNLVKAVLELGDEEAFRELYRRYTPRLLGFVSHLLAGGNPEDEDIVQETWIQASMQLDRFQWKSAFSTWLLGIGLNVVRDRLRRRMRSRQLATDLSPDPPGQHVDHAIRVDLERAISMLPDENRLVLVLHDVEGMKHHEIAERLEIPVGTTKSRLFRARRMIREWLSEKTE